LRSFLLLVLSLTHFVIKFITLFVILISLYICIKYRHSAVMILFIKK
jgi:heme/copper-type cytochrome/quinol oxidase subunit 2